MELTTPRDFRRLGSKIDEYIKTIVKIDYGYYTITDEQKEMFTIIENMTFLNEHFNKGIRLIGWDGK